MSKLVEIMIKAILELCQKLLSLAFLWIKALIGTDTLTPDTQYFSESLLGGHLGDIMNTFTHAGYIIAIFLFMTHLFLMWKNGIFTEDRETIFSLVFRLMVLAPLMVLGPAFLGTIMDKGNEVLEITMDDFGGAEDGDGYLNDTKVSSLYESASNLQYSSAIPDEMLEQMIKDAGADISLEEMRESVESTSKVTDAVSTVVFIPGLHTIAEWVSSAAGQKYIESKTGVTVPLFYLLNSTTWEIFNGIINLILYGVLAYYYFKLVFEEVRRYMTMMISYMFNGLCNSFVATSVTQAAFGSYYKMFGCEVFVFVITKIWIDLSIYFMEHSDATLLACLCVICFMQFGIYIERKMKDMGLSISSTGPSLLDSIIAPAFIMARAAGGAKNATSNMLTGAGALTGHTGLVGVGNALGGRPVSPADLQRTMDSHPLGRARINGMAKSGVSSSTPSIKKNAGRLLKENGLFRNMGFNNAFNSQNAAGKADILKDIGNSMFSNFKNGMAAKGIGVEFTGYDMNKGLGFSEYDKNGKLLGTGYITDSMPKDSNGNEFKVMGDDGSTYYGSYTPNETSEAPIFGENIDDKSWIGGTQTLADGSEVPQVFSPDSGELSTSLEAGSGIKMSADRLQRTQTGTIDTDSGHYMITKNDETGWSTLGYNAEGDSTGEFLPYAVVTEKGNTYRGFGADVSEADIYSGIRNSGLAKQGYEIQEGSLSFKPGDQHASFDVKDVATGDIYKMGVKNVVAYPQMQDRNIVNLGPAMGHCVFEKKTKPKQRHNDEKPVLDGNKETKKRKN